MVENYSGPAYVVVSCVTRDWPHRPHPHNLVGRDGCRDGVAKVALTAAEALCVFTSLGIQCVKRRDIAESLRVRQALRVDPFNTGFEHAQTLTNSDLSVVRLCFQVLNIPFYS